MAIYFNKTIVKDINRNFIYTVPQDIDDDKNSVFPA